MDKYTQIVLTIIAVCLIAIVIKLWEPAPAYSEILDKGPTTWGDVMDLRNLKGEARKKERLKILRNIPLIKIHGQVDISGSVEVENTVSVEVENTVGISGSVACY